MKDSSLKVNDLNMVSQVLQQYRDISINSNKLFFYAYGKLDVKLQAIEKDSHNVEVRDLVETEVVDLKVRINHSELRELFNREEIRKRDIDIILKYLTDNAFIKLYDKENEREEIIFIYDRIRVEGRSQYIEVFFNESAITLFENIRRQSYAKINFHDVVHLSTKYQMNLYLYALTILRGNSGVITMNKENLRYILSPDSIIDDNSFIHRFIMVPSKKITNNDNISISVYAEREGDNITIRVYKK